MVEPATTERALFGFRVGGVQEFIDSARTTEDFWASSYIISHLTQTAAEVVTRVVGSEDLLIFPSRSGREPRDDQAEADLRIADFPNGILADVPLAIAQNGLGGQVEQRFDDAWKAAMSAVRVDLELTDALETRGACDIWDRQAGRKAFETFWAWTPVVEGESYLSSYRRLSGLLEARKLLRNFDFSGGGEPHTKCTQCGKLQALQDFDGFSEKKSRTYWEHLANAYGVKYRFRPSERLCAICVTCRMASQSGAFGKKNSRRAQPSTSSIAVSPWLRTIFEIWLEVSTEPDPTVYQSKKDAFLGLIGDFVRAAQTVMKAVGVRPLPESPYRGLHLERYDDAPPEALKAMQNLDGQWFFSGTYEIAFLNKEYVGKEDREVPAENLTAARKSLENLCKDLLKFSSDDTRQGKSHEPSRYLALVKMDGDRVGDWISGKFSDEDPTVRSHRELSRALGKIGRAAGPVIETELMGRLIYSGGDDLLFLAPVAGLTGGIATILERVKGDMGKAYDLFRFSAAVLVMPHSDSLSGSIREVDHLLRTEAKEKYDRDCVVISARRQSGQKTYAALRSRHCREFQTIVTAMANPEQAGGLSPRIASQFSGMVAGLDGHGADTKALKDMSLYLLGRHANETGALELTVGLRNAITALTDAAPAMGEKNKGAGQYLENALLTARFLERSEAQR